MRYWLTFFLAGSLVCLPLAELLGQPVFTEVSEQAGINHIFLVFEGTFGGGAAVLDFDRDGWEDVFITGGAGKDQLLRNQGDGTFKNVADAAGLEVLDGLVSQGASSADVNKDGWPDLFVTTIAAVEGSTFTEAPNVLLINNGDGTFSDRSAAYGLTAPTFSAGASFGDVNKDGYPDLYIANYFENFEGTLDRYGGPISGGNTRPAEDLFYINEGGRRFVESSQVYGIAGRGLTFQALWTDFDNDRDLDLLVANDFGDRAIPNLLYRNDYPQNKFTEIGAEMDFDYGMNAMGFGATDINGDGRLDYLVTNIQVSPFFINQGPDKPFSEESIARGTGFYTVGTDSGNRITPVSWGVNFFDMDHDMDDDLYITNGCLNPVLAPSPNLLLINDGTRFLSRGRVTSTDDHSIGRGSVVFDYDRDGDLDILVVNQAPYSNEDVGAEFLGTRLYRNDQNSGLNWIKIQLEGIRSESSGIGARVEAHAGGQRLIREVYGGSSHESQSSAIVHFGLGGRPTIDSVVVQWPAGHRQSLTDVAVNQELLIVEEINAYQNPTGDNVLTISPNPLESATTIRFELAEAASWSLEMYNLLGQKVATLQTGEGAFGTHFLERPAHLAPGIYLIAVRSSGFVLGKKLVVR